MLVLALGIGSVWSTASKTPLVTTIPIYKDFKDLQHLCNLPKVRDFNLNSQIECPSVAEYLSIIFMHNKASPFTLWRDRACFIDLLRRSNSLVSYSRTICSESLLSYAGESVPVSFMQFITQFLVNTGSAQVNVPVHYFQSSHPAVIYAFGNSHHPKVNALLQAQIKSTLMSAGWKPPSAVPQNALAQEVQDCEKSTELSDLLGVPQRAVKSLPDERCFELFAFLAAEKLKPKAVCENAKRKRCLKDMYETSICYTELFDAQRRELATLRPQDVVIYAHVEGMEWGVGDKAYKVAGSKSKVRTTTKHLVIYNADDNLFMVEYGQTLNNHTPVILYRIARDINK